jgi:hypothetical protein
LGVLYGASVAAQLEAVRAGEPAPRSPQKAASGPSLEPVGVGSVAR